MIDIVFQLIAFFVFSLSFESSHLSSAVQPPLWDERRPDHRLAVVDVVVELDTRGFLLWNQQVISPDTPEFALAVEQAVNQVAKEGVFVIRADQETQFRGVDRVLESCRKQGFQRIALRLRRPEAS